MTKLKTQKIEPIKLNGFETEFEIADQSKLYDVIAKLNQLIEAHNQSVEKKGEQ